MGKIAERIYEIDREKIIERGFHKESNQVSESIFSLGNEYMGVRAAFDEGSSLPSLRGTYYNGIYDYGLEETPNAYKGIVKRTHFTLNSPDFFKIELKADGVKLDLGTAEIEDFYRELDLRSGLLTRKFAWLVNDKRLSVSFRRLVSMSNVHLAAQEIELEAEEPIDVSLSFVIDGTILHWGSDCYYRYLDHRAQGDNSLLSVKTLTTKQSVTTAAAIVNSLGLDGASSFVSPQAVRTDYSFSLKGKAVFTRYVSSIADKAEGKTHFEALDEAISSSKRGFECLLKGNLEFFQKAYEASDIVIQGDDEDQQGMRFCVFQLLQAYHGLGLNNTIGAKGLTGEAYSGHAFWDNETYCLPFYLLTNQKAAKDLLLFRYDTLEAAKARARDLDCEGACFPIATRNGEEACSLWQHASCQLQPTTAVCYGIYHYMNLYHDEEFMRNYGLEMLLESARFLLSRGDYGQNGRGFSFFGVMGPDEFQVMVNDNFYTNFMAKWTFSYVLSLLDDPAYKDLPCVKKLGYDENYVERIKKARDEMVILFDDKTKIYEQHSGFFNLPHIDVDKIPVSDFPLYSHWSYDRIYRNDMIKQPDVLMAMFLFPSSFSDEEVKVNYEYYEPRCIHESSLSPSIHSVIAERLHKEKEALDFFGFATRLDLDDYNRNTREGLHMTSIAAAYVNVVYGFLGLRTDDAIPSIDPRLPARWTSYEVPLSLKGSSLRITVKKGETLIENKGEPLLIRVKGVLKTLGTGITRIASDES